MELTIEDRLDLVLAIPNNRLRRLGITEADLSRRDLLKRAGGAAVAGAMPGSDMTKKIINVIMNPSSNPVAAKSIFNIIPQILVNVADGRGSWDEVVSKFQSDPDIRDYYENLGADIS